MRAATTPPAALPRPPAEGSSAPVGQGAQQLANLKEQRLRDHQAERELVRWAVDDADARPDVLDRASPELFTLPAVRRIYDCLQELYLNGRDVNPASLASMVQVKTSSKELAVVAEELQRVLQQPKEDSYDNLIVRLQTCKKCRLLHQEVLQEGLRRFMANEPVDDILDFVSDQLLSVDTGAPKHQMSVKDAAAQVLENILNPKTADMGLRTGLESWDLQFGGIKKDRMYVIGGYTGAGKTAVVTDFIWRLLAFNPGNVAICFFSLEMSTPRIVQRVYSRIAHVSVNRQDDHKKPGHTPLTQNEQNRLVQAYGDLAGWSDQGAWKVEYASISARQIRSRGRRFALQNKGKHLVFILDHLGLVEKTTADNRIEFDRIMDALKDLQRQFNATTIPLIQLKKETEAPSNRGQFYRPNSSFIMESVGVEAMADAVILLWRPAKFHKEFPTIPYAGVPDWDPQGKLVGIVAKNRDGAAHNDIIWQANMAFNELGDLDDSGL